MQLHVNTYSENQVGANNRNCLISVLLPGKKTVQNFSEIV